MKHYSVPLIEFNPKLSWLSKNELQVLSLLKEAAKLIIPLYKKQENQKFPGANFYPHDIKKEEIEKAAKKDPQILSAYTIVERIGGKLVATPYHEKYAEFLKPIANKLEEAAKITEDKGFAKVLKAQTKALLDDSYERAIIARLQMKPYILDICLGPNDYFDDQLFFRKGSYQAWVGVLDKEATEKFNKYKEIILSSQRRTLIPNGRIDNNGHVEVRVEDVLLFSGLLARTKFVGLNIPFDLNIVERYGSDIILFKQAGDLRVEEQILPTFNIIFSEGFKQGFTKEDLKMGNIGYVALHELAHSYLHYKNAVNLKDLRICIEELTATTLGFRVGGSLFLKDLVTTKQLESMIAVYLCRSMYLVKNMKNDKSMSNYALGGAIFLNFMLDSGAIRQYKGLTIANFTKIFVATHDLSLVMERLLSGGSRKDAEIFIKKYGQFPQLS